MCAQRRGRCSSMAASSPPCTACAHAACVCARRSMTRCRAREEIRKRVNMVDWGDKMIIAVVSRLTPQKGTHLIKHAAYKVRVAVCVCVPACLPACLPACVRVCMCACLRACVSACLCVCVRSASHSGCASQPRPDFHTRRCHAHTTLVPAAPTRTRTAHAHRRSSAAASLCCWAPRQTPRFRRSSTSSPTSCATDTRRCAPAHVRALAHAHA
jgi:hypothetical protein